MTCSTKVIPFAFLTLLIITLEISSVTAASRSHDGNGEIENHTEKSEAAQVPLARVAEQPTEQNHIIDGKLDSVDWQSLVGQNVTISGDLMIVDTHDLARRGQVKVARSRLYVPTSQIDPNDADPNQNSFEGGSNVAQVTAAQKLNDRGTIIIDDGSSAQNVFPPKLFPELGKSLPSVRIGSTIKGVSGKLIKAGKVLLLVPNQPLNWTPAPRPERPNIGNADVTVASFNVLNYFTTIDDGNNNARGADSKAELERQEAKIVAAIIGLQADVIGLMEIENNLEAETRLVAALNERIGKPVFAGCGLPDNFRNAPGGNDAIRVGMIYRADRVVPLGGVSMITDDAFYKARTPIVQQFRSRQRGKPFAVIVNHFKSKGSASRADVADKNKGDGQGAYNATRRAQALAICNYIDALEQKDPKFRALVIGDLNAYDQEDPIDAMRAKGLIDLQERVVGSTSTEARRDYSYVYRGQSGTLDHAMATKSLANAVTGIATWHINCDEPRSMDYNTEYNPKLLYRADPFRSSDHDPVLIGIKN
ncbi:ExeM/NucH family extracellular endonuclease [Mariniblastus sp.]|nr:ExeM/NucH family extracellular endonuclease [Mariniblastus sp.]